MVPFTELAGRSLPPPLGLRRPVRPRSGPGRPSLTDIDERRRGGQSTGGGGSATTAKQDGAQQHTSSFPGANGLTSQFFDQARRATREVIARHGDGRPADGINRASILPDSTHRDGSIYSRLAAMVLAVASSNGNAPTASDDHAAALRSPMLLNYRPSTPPVDDHLLLDMPQQQGCCQLPTFNDDEGDASLAKRGKRRVVDWASVRRACGEWMSNPMNVALLLWLLCVGVSGGILVLLLLGLLDGAFPSPAVRNHWIEVNNQFLNGLFTLLSLYQHPTLFHHTFLLCRWRPGDAVDLRDAYCSGDPTVPRPAERAHMAVVVALLHLTLACQYVTCGLYWGYTVTARPDLLADGFFVLGIVAPLAAAVYAVSSPLGRERHHDLSLLETTKQEQSLSPVVGHVVVEPEWSGRGMFDCAGDASTWWLSLSCTFCVFGWNMERLGFGNAFVHASTFALLCLAPVWVLGVSALHIHDYVIGDAVGVAGVLLCAGGLLYGGYWRIQMRKRFGLPGSRACCGSKSLTDYARWLFCWPFALAQEVRTASLYHVHGEHFYHKQVAAADDDHAAGSIVEPLLLVGSNDRHHGVFRATDTAVAASQASPPEAHHLVVTVDDETTMAPPPVQVVVVHQARAVEEGDAHLSQASPADAHLVVTVDNDTAMAPPVQVVVVQQAVEDDKSDERTTLRPRCRCRSVRKKIHLWWYKQVMMKLGGRTALTDEGGEAWKSSYTNSKKVTWNHRTTRHQETNNPGREKEEKKKKERFLDFLRAAPSKELWLRRLGIAAPKALLRRVATLRANSIRAPAAFARTVDWRALRGRCKAWARRPTNAALLVWLAFVAVGVAFVFLLMIGALDSVVPDESRRRRWTEVANQILNALFTIMCIYQHPRLCHHLVLLFRWRHDTDVAELRSVYCKNAAGPPRRERLHVGVVLLLLHATCFAQYAYCALFWVFSSSQTRPGWAVNMTMALGLGFPVAAAVYMVYGPLGKKIAVLPAASTDDDEDEEAAVVQDDESSTANTSHDKRVAVTKPEWAGGLLDVGDDPTVAALSVTCTFCVFGWNMERLGMGNMYVHVFTFVLLCAAPVLVFAVAAIHMHDRALGSVVGAAGAVLSVLGLLYGGFWRAQMRRRLGLPTESSVCGGRAATADYVKWLLCAPCALAQEVRTANLYDVDVEEGNVVKLYVRSTDDEDVSSPSDEKKPAIMAPLEREGCIVDAPPVPVMVVS
ncbi:hypothetical protein HU200_050057 [Digitaria exilis]|uniref:Uncharacterized protein n=1 Tax=Digitaria exilis TaxID=1010633 RepID=A0A835E6B3_9POAL|nr:hypothetical protein HU200_050057 [Digitaria exilis]